MPAERTQKPSNRAGEDSFQLTWPPIEPPPAPQTFSFAPNVTPVTFTAPPPAVDDIPTESTLFPSAFVPDDPHSPPRRQTHGKKRASDHIPRPPNAFILFRSSFIKSQHVSSQIEGNHGTLSKIVGMLWHNLPYEERQVWQAKARKALADHKRKWPEYSFRPLHGKDKDKDTAGTAGGTGKRKVREVGPRDSKRCEVIASLLANGKKGDELAAAIHEFDRHRVPEVQTRFEAPLTARQYRRSSSAPLPDTEKSKAESAFVPSSPAPRTKGVRASSTRPQRLMTPQPQPLSRQATVIPDTPAPSEAGSSDCWDANSSWSSDVSVASSPSSAFYTQKFETDAAFDFASFSFAPSECTTPASDCFSPFEAAPSPVSDENALGVFFNDSFAPQQQQQHQHQQPLSIQTSWAPTEYEQSPLSSVPHTPHEMASCYQYESQGFYTPVTPPAFDFAYAQSQVPAVYDAPHQQQQQHQQHAHAPPSFGEFGSFQFDAGEKLDFAPHAAGDVRFDMQAGKFGFELAELDPAFSRFMAQLPNY